MWNKNSLCFQCRPTNTRILKLVENFNYNHIIILEHFRNIFSPNYFRNTHQHFLYDYVLKTQNKSFSQQTEGWELFSFTTILHERWQARDIRKFHTEDAYPSWMHLHCVLSIDNTDIFARHVFSYRHTSICIDKFGRWSREISKKIL